MTNPLFGNSGSVGRLTGVVMNTVVSSGAATLEIPSTCDELLREIKIRARLRLNDLTHEAELTAVDRVLPRVRQVLLAGIPAPGAVIG